MASGLTPDVRVYPSVGALSRAAARNLVDRIHAAVTGGAGASGGARCSLALAGGSTPRALYRLLAAEHRDRIPWEGVHIFWGDERYVPSDDPRSNYGMARETLLDHVPVPAENVHPMPADFPDPDEAARAYEATMRTHLPGLWPRFDLILLGLGADGHTASLFSGSPALKERERWVVSIRAPADPSLRLTLTLPVLNHAAHVWFLVAGTDKASALQRALSEPPDARACPASAVRPGHGAVVWWVDEAAAAGARQIGLRRPSARGRT